MSTKKRKRKIEKKNSEDARKLVMVAIGLTLFFLLLSYIFFVRNM